jgi:hypothetical protein
MSLDLETIAGLLPEVYRTRDAEIAESLTDLLTPAEQAQLQTLRDALAAGDALDATQQRDLARLERKRLRGPLEALLAILAEQVAGLEENIEQLYDDQFIETCADWVVPYIADLVGHHPLDPQLQRRLGSARAEVANTIRFRRRKGTAAVLEELAVNITDWDAAVVEFFLRLATTQYLNHLRHDNTTVDLRRVDQLEAVGTPFDRLSHTADARRIDTRGGRYNIPNVGIFLWRVKSWTLTDSPAARVDARRYLFSPLGANTQLFHAAERETEVTRLAEPLTVPLPITRRALRRELGRLYGPGRSLSIQVGSRVLTIDEVEACDLSDTGPDPETSAWAHSGQTKVAIDPVLGRIAFPSDTTEPVLVTYYYGFTAALGGGEYDRTETEERPEPVREVPRDRTTITEALSDVAGAGTVEIDGSGAHREAPALMAAADGRLVVRAANEVRPLLDLGGSDLVVGGGDSGEVILDGLLISGGRVVVPAQVNGEPNRLQRLRLVHCTLVPGGRLTRAGLPGPAPTSVEVAASNVTVEIERCIVGGLRVTDESSASLSDSIVDSLGRTNVAYAATGGTGDDSGGPLTVDACTVIGKLRTAELRASNAIFHAALAESDTWSAPVIVERRQSGYVRYSAVPWNAQLPPRYNCQPRRHEDAERIVPRFTSLRYSDPGYGQLHAGCPHEIRCGAEEGGELGAFYELFAPQRAAGLNVRLDEYLRFGLEAGLIYAS